jgi:iron complex transport system substrate-binding protein
VFFVDATTGARSIYAISIVALIVASLAVGFAAYGIHKISSLSKIQSTSSEELKRGLINISTTLDVLSSNISNISARMLELENTQESSRAHLEHEIEVLSASLNELKEFAKRLQSQQETQASNVTSLMKTVSELESELSKLEDSLNNQKLNLTIISKELKHLGSRIDYLYSLYLFPVTISDATGKPVTISSKPTRIISLLPSVTEILWAVNASSQVIAVDEYSNYPPQVPKLVKEGKLINIGSGWYPDVELILSLKPDLVVGVDSVESHHSLKEILAEYGIPVVLLPDRNFKDVIDSILLVGRITGHPVEAADLASKLEAQALALRSYIDDYLNETNTPRQSVALIAWVNPLWVVGVDTFQNDIILLADGVNAYSNLTGWKPVSPESLLEANPDVIVVTAGHQGLNITREQFIAYLKKYLGDAVYNITAVKTGRIYFVSGDYNDMMVRPGPRVVDAAMLMAVLLYPQAFNLTPSQIPAQVTPHTFKLPQLVPNA